MSPPYDPDLQPTTTSPVELRYFNVLPGILDQLRQTGHCIAPAHFVATCYAPNVPEGLREDSRILQQTTDLTTDLALWCAGHNINFTEVTWPLHQYVFYNL